MYTYILVLTTCICICIYSKLPLHTWIALLTILVHHAYVMFGGNVYAKLLGIPHGIQFAVHVVNLHFLSYELQFALKKCLSAQGRVDLCNVFSCFRRLIDDIAVFGGKSVSALLGCMYPSYVALDHTWDKSERKGTFLNILTSLGLNGCVSKHIAFKEDKLPFVPVQYIHADANRSRKSALHCILSQLLVAVLLNDSKTSCVNHFRKLINIFISNGFAKGELHHVVLPYLRRTDFSLIQRNYVAMDAWHTAYQHIH
jgi:hypothetical protein